jgi:CheY-like chemotaxis protein
MKECLILIVEDDPEAIDSWKRDIKEFNEDQAEDAFNFEAVYASTCQDALKVLNRTRINCAVIDLRLPPTSGGDNSTATPLGNDILETVLIETGVPAVVYSAHAAEASEMVRNSNIQIRSKKGSGGTEILTYLASHEGLMAAMEITRKKIAIESAKIFNDSIWKRWEITWNSMADRGVLAGMITRQIASHVADRLSLPPANHHPDEFYIIPPLFAARLDTGDLITENSHVYVVVTPRCNMANEPQPTHLMLALCRPMTTEWNDMREGFNLGLESKKGKSAVAKLRNFSVQNHSTSTHFIPPCGDRGPWLVDFKETKGVLSTATPELLQNRFASISTHFVPNLVQRYAAYLGRIGQPDLDWNILREHICK